MPILTVDGKGTVGQSIAIARFVAREHGTSCLYYECQLLCMNIIKESNRTYLKF